MTEKLEPKKNGGKRPGSGRKKGVPNKVTLKREAEIAASGLTPLDFMLQTMRDEDNEFTVRLDAAKAAAPFVHPKLQPVDGKTGSAELHVVGRIELVDLNASSPDSAAT